MAIGDVYKVRVLAYNGTGGSAHLGFNIMHWVVTGQTGLGVTAAEIAAALDTTWESAYKACISVNARYRGVGVQRIAPTLDAEATVVANDGAGTATGDLLSGQCGLIGKRSLLGGRQNTGRLYVPFPSENNNTAGNAPDGAYQIVLAALVAAIDIGQLIVGAGGSATLNQVIYHRASGTHTFVIALTKSDAWATQRRRMPRGRARPLPF